MLAKSKRKPKSSSKTKASSVTKSKKPIKAKSSAKPKTKLKAKPKAKPKAKSKTILKSVAKAKPKANGKSTLKKKAKSSTIEFTPTQIKQLLSLIGKLVNLHKVQQGGLMSLAGVADILDQYNQHYKEATDKFDAIIKYAEGKNPNIVYEHIFTNTQERQKDINDLYELLSNVSSKKLAYDHVADKMKEIYKRALDIYG